MASRKRKEAGYYAALNALSVADIMPKPGNRRCKGKGRLWKVERLISERKAAVGGTEYLVLWQGYSPYEATWQNEEDITAECLRLYSQPQPQISVVLQEVAALRSAVEQHLKSTCRLAMTLPFRGDVFKFLFQGKGTTERCWCYLGKADFPTQYFPPLWDQCADSHGQGIKVFYPIKMRSFISWSPKKYCVGNDGVFKESPRAFFEKVSFSFVKVALGDESE